MSGLSPEQRLKFNSRGTLTPKEYSKKTGIPMVKAGDDQVVTDPDSRFVQTIEYYKGHHFGLANSKLSFGWQNEPQTERLRESIRAVGTIDIKPPSEANVPEKIITETPEPVTVS